MTERTKLKINSNFTLERHSVIEHSHSVLTLYYKATDTDFRFSKKLNNSEVGKLVVVMSEILKINLNKEKTEEYSTLEFKEPEGSDFVNSSESTKETSNSSVYEEYDRQDKIDDIAFISEIIIEITSAIRYLSLTSDITKFDADSFLFIRAKSKFKDIVLPEILIDLDLKFSAINDLFKTTAIAKKEEFPKFLEKLLFELNDLLFICTGSQKHIIEDL